jgi:periplasmic protein TonB
MKYLSAVLTKYISLGLVLLCLVTGMATLIAIAPKDLFKAEVEAPPKPTTVKLAEPPQPIEPVVPPKSQTLDSTLMSSLAPDSFANPDFGAGVSFGSGGSGPAVGGSGGFGSDASMLANERSSMNRAPKLSIKGSLEYPSDARQKNISGFVTLKILVSESGFVQNVEVEESDPPGIFDQAAIRSVKNWKFEPGMIQGKLSAAWTSQRIKFELN